MLRIKYILKMFKKKTRYDFGRNWKQYSETITEFHIKQAQKSLFHLVDEIEGKTVLDIRFPSSQLRPTKVFQIQPSLFRLSIQGYDLPTGLIQKPGHF